jgi:hypothetical protein
VGLCQGIRPAAKARSRGGQRKVAGDKEQWALFCSLGCRMVARGSSYHSPIFCLIMMRVGAEDQELERSIGLFSCFLLAGCVIWGRILRLLWHPGWGLHSSPLNGFGEVDIPGGTTG